MITGNIILHDGDKSISVHIKLSENFSHINLSNININSPVFFEFFLAAEYKMRAAIKEIQN